MKLQSPPGAWGLPYGSSPGHLQEGGSCWPVSADSKDNRSPSQEEEDNLQNKENIFQDSHSKDKYWQIKTVGKMCRLSPQKSLVQKLPVKCHQLAFIHMAVTPSQLHHSWAPTESSRLNGPQKPNYTANLSTTERLKILFDRPLLLLTHCPCRCP